MISQAFLGNLGVETDHPPKMCAGLLVVHPCIPARHWTAGVLGFVYIIVRGRLIVLGVRGHLADA